MSLLPSGKITFLFTDIEGSTLLSQKFPQQLQRALEKHNSILRESVTSNNGFVFEITGDAFSCSFENTMDAIKASMEIQERLNDVPWEEISIKIRIGIHTGEAVWNGSKYVGYITLAKTQRLMSAAYGGQILISEESIDNIGDSLIGKVNLRDLGKRRLKNIIKPVRIYQILSDRLENSFPPLKTLDKRQDNLPLQLTSFIGREEEILKIKELLNNNQLLTLKGPGGSGKTRLAVKVASESIDEFADGVRFVDLTSVRDQSLLYQMLESVLKIKESTDLNPEETISDNLKDKELLLILDNCEQIVEVVANITEYVLLKCPKLKILTTSREALNCSGEMISEIKSLKLPKPGKKMSPSELSGNEAVSLFIDRARKVDPDFTVDSENSDTLIRICRQLDGIPLAIELAASRMNVLPIEKINERLNDRFKFLTGGKRTAVPKNQTLKAMVDWSYDLIPENEKLLWNRLSVFADGCTLEAAEIICSDDKINTENVLNLMSSLTDKSLLIYSKESERFRMLETIRQYGEEKLAESGELELIISKHLDYFIDFAVKAYKEISGRLQKEIIKKLDDEKLNIQLALTSSIARNQKAKGIKLAIYLCRYWEIRGNITSAKNWLEEFLANEDEVPEFEKANALMWMGTYEWILGNYDRSEAYYERCLTTNKNLDNKRGVAVSLNNLGLLANSRGEFFKSKEYAEESNVLLKEIGDKALIADGLMNLGSVLINLNEMEESKFVFEESLKQYRELGDIRGTAMILTNLGSIYRQKAEYILARNYLEEGLAIQREIGDNRAISDTLDNLARVMNALGFNRQAIKLLEESILILTETGEKKLLAGCMNNLGFIKYEEGEFENSLDLHREGLQIQQEIGDKAGMLNSFIGSAENFINEDQERACMILGFVEEKLNSNQHELEKEIKLKKDKLINMLREKSGEEMFNENFRKGSSFSEEHTIEFILKKNEYE